MSSAEINTVPCPVNVVAVRGDYLAWRVEINVDCQVLDLTAYNYIAEVFQTTRRIDESNPCGGIVRVAKVTDLNVELDEASDPKAIVLSLLPEQTEMLNSGCCYQWSLRWYSTDIKSIRTISAGSITVI